jgi:hypothetical protein
MKVPQKLESFYILNSLLELIIKIRQFGIFFLQNLAILGLFFMKNPLNRLKSFFLVEIW